MIVTRILVGAVLASSLVSFADAKTHSPNLRDQQQAACFNDVQRLCADAMPDVAKVTACMKPKKAQVSPGCRAMWDVKG